VILRLDRPLQEQAWNKLVRSPINPGQCKSTEGKTLAS